MPDDVTDHLPLTPLSFHILLALAEGPLHGYGVIKWLQERPDRAIDPRTGSFYAAIRRMGSDGLLARTEPPGGSEDVDERRRYYCLTPLGRRTLRAEADRLARLAREARVAIAGYDP